MLESREAEIDHLDAAVGGVHHVFRLQVAVDDAVCVRRRQGARDVARYGQDFVDGEGTPPQRFAQRASGHVLADEVQVAVELLEREDRGDAGMRQGGGGHCLPPQPRAEPVVVNEFRRQRLDRHRPIEAGVPSEIDDAHPAAPEQAGDLIRTELPPDQRVAGAAGKQVGVGRRGQLLQRARFGVRPQERSDLVGKRGIAGAFPIEVGVPPGRLPFKRRVEQVVDPLPAFRIHRRPG